MNHFSQQIIHLVSKTKDITNILCQFENKGGYGSEHCCAVVLYTSNNSVKNVKIKINFETFITDV